MNVLVLFGTILNNYRKYNSLCTDMIYTDNNLLIEKQQKEIVYVFKTDNRKSRTTYIYMVYGSLKYTIC